MERPLSSDTEKRGLDDMLAYLLSFCRAPNKEGQNDAELEAKDLVAQYRAEVMDICQDPGVVWNLNQ